jgi:ATP-dependent Lon protease
MPELDTIILPLMPLEGAVVLPGMVLTLALQSEEALSAFAAAQASQGELLMVPRTVAGYARVGTVARVEELSELPEGGRAIAVRALSRARLITGVPGPIVGPATWIEAERTEDPPTTPEAVALAREFRALVESILEVRGAGPLARSLKAVTDPGPLADTAGYLPDLSFDQRVELLEAVDLEGRLRLVIGWAREILAGESVKQQIRHDVDEGMEKAQREFLLRQQLATIRRELGEDDGEGLVEAYRQKLESTDLPVSARERVAQEIERLSRLSEQNPEHGWLRGWLDTVFDLPWAERTPDVVDLAQARSVLDADHRGLEDVKSRIIEHIAVRSLRAERSHSRPQRGEGAVLALVGPPGVGKTSLGESVARATGRRFARMSLGGIRDESEIRGHRRTYVGALPGRVVRAVQDAGSMNPVIVLDEIDKVGADWRGDPSAALLEVLDPAQNDTFRDHYLDIDLDLSGVIFIATANAVETIPPALLDRLEVLRLDGYTEEEKVEIATGHLLPRLIDRVGLRADEVRVTAAAITEMVRSYTREPGVRDLERQLAKVLRKVAASVAGRKVEPPVVIDVGEVKPYLGRPRIPVDSSSLPVSPGVARGLAVTPVGGEVLSVEAAALRGRSQGDLVLTGQLGDVMKESATIALSYVRAHPSELRIDEARLSTDGYHLHVPAGAVPKDGPSAGITMVTALVSLLTDRPMRPGVAMTGELSLQGRVLAIGGVKQKVLAAHRAGLGEVILPKDNAADLEEVPDSVREKMTFHLVSEAAEAVQLALDIDETRSRAA